MSEIKVSDSVNKRGVTLGADQNLESAWATMAHLGVNQLAVSDGQGHVVGLLSKPVDSPRLSSLGGLVRDVMTPPPPRVSLQTGVRQAAKQMLDQRVSALVVMDQEKIVGLLTHEDLLQTLVDVLEDHPNEFKRIEALLYNSPLASVVNTLSDAGI